MSLDVDIQIASEEADLPTEEQLILWAQAALRETGDHEVTIRIVDAEEIGNVAAFLASPKSGAITGVAIDASGGSIPVVFP